MAAQLGVSRETVGRWINGKGAPKRAGLLAWASLTGVDLHWLETGEGPTSPTSGPDPDKLPRLDSNQQPSGYRFALVTGGVPAGGDVASGPRSATTAAAARHLVTVRP